MNYDNVKTPEDLMHYMNENIHYGVYDYKNNKAYYGDDENFEYLVNNIWRLSSPEQMQKYGVGHCFDQVELERDFFKKYNYNFKTFFIWFKCNRQNNYPSHTYLVYQDKSTKEWCWFEHSDYNNKGIHGFKTLQDVINAQKHAHIKYAKSYRKSKTDASKIEILEYDNVTYGCTVDEFMNYVLSTGKQIKTN